MNKFIKTIKSLEKSGVLIDGVTEKVKHEIKKQEGGFLGALLAPLAASIKQSVISSIIKGVSGRGVRRAGRGYMKEIFLIPHHPLNNIEITNYFNCEPRFNGVFSRNNLPRIKDGTYSINLDDRNSKGTHWASLFMDGNTILYYDSFELDIFLKRY